MRQFSLKLDRAIGTLPPPPCIVSPQGPARCPHHLLLISKADLETGNSNACGFCNPAGNSDNGNTFVMPAFSDHPLSDSGRARANKKAAPGHCECGSRIHVIEANGTWRCADCLARIRVPKGLTASAQNDVEAEIVQ